MEAAALTIIQMALRAGLEAVRGTPGQVAQEIRQVPPPRKEIVAAQLEQAAYLALAVVVVLAVLVETGHLQRREMAGQEQRQPFLEHQLLMLAAALAQITILQPQEQQLAVEALETTLAHQVKAALVERQTPAVVVALVVLAVLAS